MIETAFLKDLKKGDKVIYCVSGPGFYNKTVKEVQNITPKGFIKVNSILFSNITGDPRGANDGYVSCYLEEATPDRIKEIQEEKYIYDTLVQMRKCESLTYEQAKAVRKALRTDN